MIVKASAGPGWPGLPAASRSRARSAIEPLTKSLASWVAKLPLGWIVVAAGRFRTLPAASMTSARAPHNFLGIDQDGVTSIIRTTGNPHGHIVLRGGRLQANYDPESISDAVGTLKKAGLPPVLMVDCSHANSGKQHARQEEVWRSVMQQRSGGNKTLIGLMVESYLEEGNQPIRKRMADLRHGVSITDACIGWETTERMLRHGHEVLRNAGKPAGALCQ